MTKTISLLSLLTLTATACTNGDGPVVRTMTDRDTGAEFDVEVRFAGGATVDEAQALADSIEVVPARIAFPTLDPAVAAAAQADDDVTLDESEPTFQVVLHPLNAEASAEPYAWRSTDRGAAPASTADGTGTVEQGIDVGCSPTLGSYDDYRTARYYCHAFDFTATIGGLAYVCADAGYNSNAGSVCTIALNSTQTVVNPGPNLNPFDKHYFRGRVSNPSIAPVCVYGKAHACL